MAAHESLVFVMVDTSMVFAHVCKRKGADADMLGTLMEDIEVLGHIQIVFKWDQENSVKAVQRERELAVRRPEMKLKKQSKVSFIGTRHSGKRSAARDWVDEGAERRT